MPPQPRPVPRWRLDAVALVLLAAGAVLAACVGTYRPLTGRANLLGPAGDDAARWLVEALGAATGVLLAGWFAVVAAYVARCGWAVLAVRTAGWLVLAAAGVAAADYAAGGLTAAPVSA